MTTTYEYAQMCVAVYRREGHSSMISAKSGSWRFITSSPMNDFGYYANVYRNDVTKKIVIAHCGTDATVFANLRADLQIARGQIPTAYQFVRSFSEGIHQDYRDTEWEITETGHSLGAIYAELNALNFGCKAVTFESPGSRDLVEELPATVDITTYLSAPNFINTSGGHIGRVFRLYPPHVESAGLRVEDARSYANYLALFYSTTEYLRLILTLGIDIFSYTQRLHSMEGLLSVFDPNLHAPRLQTEPPRWPSRTDFINSTLWAYLHPEGKFHLYFNRLFPWIGESFNSIFNGGVGRTVAKNIRLEDNVRIFIGAYLQPQAFFMPGQECCIGVAMPDMRQFVRRSRQELITFFENEEVISAFDRDLNTFQELHAIPIDRQAQAAVDETAALEIDGDFTTTETAIAQPSSSEAEPSRQYLSELFRPASPTTVPSPLPASSHDTAALQSADTSSSSDSLNHRNP